MTTHDYPEIQPSEIKAGDTIRWENPRAAEAMGRRTTALEFIAIKGGDSWRDWGTHYLIDRPAPPVDLPETPTLGWIITERGIPDLDFWRHRGPEDRAGEGVWAGNDPCGKPRGYRLKYITAFTPATAVPTEALTAVRREILRDESDRADGWGAAERLRRIIDKFLAAVDEANA